MNLAPIKKYLEKYRYQLLLLVSCGFGYFPLSSFLLIPKWDNINAFLPYRHIVATWINNGHLALWNPYQLLGYPMHADPQSGAWYPITWILGFFNNYDFHAINIELLLHFYIGGLGMFLLGRTLKLNSSIAFFMGISYMFSGFMVGTSQVLVLIIAAAWFPMSINYLIRALRKPSFKAIFLLSLINFLALTGSYPAMSLILFYAYLFVAIYFIYRTMIGRYGFINVVKVFGGTALISLLLSAAYLLSIVEVLPFMTRADAIAYTADLFAKVSFNIQCFTSFILPYSTVSNSEFFNTDISMANAYFGIFAFIAMLAGVLYSKNKKVILFFLLACCFLMISLGMQFPVHYLFYKFVPGFDLFRHPSIFRIYAIFFFILATGMSAQIFANEAEKREKAIRLLRSSIFFFGGLVIIGLVYTNYTLVDDYLASLLHLKERSPFNLAGHVLVQSTLQLILLSIAYYYVKRKKLNMQRMLVLVFVDLFLATQLNAPRTIYYSMPFHEFQSFYSSMPEGISNQKVDEPIGEMNNKNVKPKQRGLYDNLNSFYKRTAYDGYNPFKFKDFIALRKSGSMPLILNNGLFYLADTLIQGNELSIAVEGRSYAFIDPMQYKKFRVKEAAKGQLSDLKVAFNGFDVNSQIESEGLVFLNQNYNQNWHAFVDGQETKVLKANISMMGIFLPEGEHQITLKYSSRKIEIAFMISMITLFGGLLIIAVQALNQKEL